MVECGAPDARWRRQRPSARTRPDRGTEGRGSLCICERRLHAGVCRQGSYRRRRRDDRAARAGAGDRTRRRPPLGPASASRGDRRGRLRARRPTHSPRLRGNCRTFTVSTERRRSARTSEGVALRAVVRLAIVDRARLADAHDARAIANRVFRRRTRVHDRARERDRKRSMVRAAGARDGSLCLRLRTTRSCDARSAAAADLRKRVYRRPRRRNRGCDSLATRARSHLARLRFECRKNHPRSGASRRRSHNARPARSPTSRRKFERRSCRCARDRPRRLRDAIRFRCRSDAIDRRCSSYGTNVARVALRIRRSRRLGSDARPATLARGRRRPCSRKRRRTGLSAIA